MLSKNINNQKCVPKLIFFCEKWTHKQCLHKAAFLERNFQENIWPSSAIMTVNNNRNHSYGNNGDDVDNMQAEL